MIPTQLYPMIKDDLNHTNLHKNHIEIETLKILNAPDRHKIDAFPFLEDGIITNR